MIINGVAGHELVIRLPIATLCGCPRATRPREYAAGLCVGGGGGVYAWGFIHCRSGWLLDWSFGWTMILGIVKRVNLVWGSGIAFFGSLWIELLLRYCS